MRPFPFKLSRRQWAGVACIYIAAFGWAAELIIPFTTLPNKVTTFAVVLGLAESLFVIGIFLLGRKTYEQAKATLIEWLKKK